MERNIHAELGTRLIETYSWQHRNGVLRDRLREQLEDAGVSFEPIPIRSVIARLGQWLISWLARLLTTFLHHVKTSGVSPEELRERARIADDRERAASFLAVFEQVHERYEATLAEEGAVDFHDLINRAATLIGDGSWPAKYRYVLVDEFQDISAGRMALLRALDRDDTAYFLVGDDWQSIYRFAGSDVGLVRSCGDHLGHVRQRTLSQTFRFADGILRPSTAFVQRNPEQTQRPLRSARHGDDDGVTIVADDDPGRGLFRALQDIRERAAAGGLDAPSVLVLGRYPEQRAPTGRRRAAARRVQHGPSRQGSRGRLRRGPRPQERATRLPLAGRRRPAARPRASVGSLDGVSPLRGAATVVRRDDARTPRRVPRHPPAATLGVRDRVAARRGRAPPARRAARRRCARVPSVPRRKARAVPERGHAAVLEPPDVPPPRAALRELQRGLRHPERPAGTLLERLVRPPRPRVCPACGVGVLVMRYGRYGQFLGCSEYGSVPPCTHTENLPRRFG